MRRSFVVGGLCLAIWTVVPRADAAEPAKPSLAPVELPAPALSAVEYLKDIQPILSRNCYSCHGPEKHKSGLRLDTKTDALAGGDSGKVIRPGKSAESLLIQYVAGLDPEKIMPPKGDRLTREEIGKLRAWIDAGASWPEPSSLNGIAGRTASSHWAFKAPVHSELPKVKAAKWCRNPIDAFVLARLEKEKIKPSPEANRVTLIRRLSLDLLGLPPSPVEVAEFVGDRQPDAYERLVDRLLASPHFGEHWGRHWLDLARYADSDGYEKDNVRPYAYLFRDWVIQAINDDMPFDEFTIEQIAGDLLPNANEKQKLATAFHRQTLTNKEGGVDQEEFRCKATVDRVSTTSAVWLGLTAGCAECHTHKYDPITQREFYQLFAFFNNASEKDVPAPQPAELSKYEAGKKVWDAENSRRKAALDSYVKNDLPAKFATWEKTVVIPATHWSVLAVKKAEASSAKLDVQPDNSVLARGQVSETDTYTVEVETPEMKGVTGFRLEVLPESTKQPTVGRSKTGNFVLTDLTVKSSRADSQTTIRLRKAVADFSQNDFLPEGALDEDKKKTGWAIVPQINQRHVAVFETSEPLELPAGCKLAFTLDQQYGGSHTIARFRLSATTSPAPLEPDLTPNSVVAALQVSSEERTTKQRRELARYFREEIDPGAKKLHDQLATHAKKEPKFPATKAPILAADSRKTHVHIRGDFLRKGEEVEPATFAVLHPLKPRGETGEPAGTTTRLADRLDLAHWLVDSGNPLTARVTVNHIWKNLFGRALVASVNDFGTRGEKPSHPELLDWLAITFQSRPGVETPMRGSQTALGWSRKALIKLIVTSATYRQSSLSRPELVARDPNNILLARQNRFRLEAENVRDIYLSASGLLNPAIGGPSIRPHLPADIAALGYANSVKWQESKGAEQYRRGLYIFFQRTVPYPMLMTFDAPDSNATCTRRERSNTPLQALTLLNDPVFFECAQALATRVTPMAANPPERIRRAFQFCLSRSPTRHEQARLQQLYDQQLALLKNKPENTALILGEKTPCPADLEHKAALVAVSRVIMNLDEFVTRD